MTKYTPLTIFSSPRTGDDITDCMKERDELMRWWRWEVNKDWELLRKAHEETLEAQLQLRQTYWQLTQLQQRLARIERHISDYNAAQKRARTPRPIRR